MTIGTVNLYEAANRAILLSHDRHHVYVEAFRLCEDNSSHLELTTGS